MGDEYSPYAGDWALGAALGSVGVIFVGDIPLPVARDLVASGWDVVGAPLPPLDAAPPVAQPPPTTPPVATPPLDQGGPEDRAPPDFDVPPATTPATPAEPTPVTPPATTPSPPATTPPPVEGEIVGPDVVYHDYEGYDQLPGGYYPPTRARGRVIEGESVREPPPWWAGPAAAAARRVFGGPLGGAIGPVIEAGMPEVLGSGELPFPPIPKIDTTPDLPAPQFPDVAPLPAPEVPALALPEPPDVVVVTPTSSSTTPTIPRSAQTVPRALQNSVLLGALGALAPILRPRHRGREGPGLGNLQNFLTSPETNPITPAPRVRPDPLTPPAPAPGTDPLTPVDPARLLSPQTQTAPFGPQQLLTPTQQDQEDRCRCKENKHEPDPSDVIADVKVYKRRMSNWSLKNLNRGTQAANLIRKFL